VTIGVGGIILAIVEDVVSYDGTAGGAVDNQDCIDGGVGYGDVAVVDGVDSERTFAEDFGGG
jgi:hypothetical protein